jgi:hypothetical protein
MSLFQVSFKSKVLGKAVQLNVIIPEDYSSNEYHPLNKAVKFKTYLNVVLTMNEASDDFIQNEYRLLDLGKRLSGSMPPAW